VRRLPPWRPGLSLSPLRGSRRDRRTRPGDRRYGRRSREDEEEPGRGGGGPVVLRRRARGLRVVRFGSRDLSAPVAGFWEHFSERVEERRGQRRERIPTLG